MEANQNKAEGFLKQGSILAAASILVRLIGMFYRIPLANIIGDAGNGIYSAAFEVYNILLIISSTECRWQCLRWFRQNAPKKNTKELTGYFVTPWPFRFFPAD